MKSLLVLALFSSIVLSDDTTSIQFSGIETTYENKEISVKRLKYDRCKYIRITPENLFGGNLASNNIPQICKKNITTSLGIVQPIKIDKEIETVGELEVMKFLSVLEFESDKYALIDARKSHWYKEITIPNAINIPYPDIKENNKYTQQYTRALKLLNVKRDKNGKLNFSQAKEIIVFCNANWCGQSVLAIKSLIRMGYPKNKIFWYRGGLQDWAGLGFTTVKS